MGEVAYQRTIEVSRGGRQNRRVTFRCGYCDRLFSRPACSANRVRSCGCARSQALSHALRRHGDSGSPEHQTWMRMRRRCRNPMPKDRKVYAGITVCKRWASYEKFLLDMGRRPSPQHSLDRINSRGNYSPQNCRWATATEQASNRPSFVRPLTFNDETLLLSEWSKKVGLRYSVLYQRLTRGWSLEDTLTLPWGHRWPK
jgi:hypothetical protein